MRSARSWPGTCAAARGTKASCAASAAIWTAGKGAKGMEHKDYRAINKPVRKKDSMQLLLGKPVYTDDITPRDALVVMLLRSPHANAIVQEIDTSLAGKVPGVDLLHDGVRVRRAQQHDHKRVARGDV